VIVGAVPLLAYALPRPRGLSVLALAGGLSLLVLAAIGAARAPFVDRPPGRSAAEMTAIGVLAGMAAYAAGVVGRHLAR
jgi:VIT1/CCC1 family predicted Fe2+/Mn2+ transporter